MKVHEIERNPTLQVPVYTTDRDLGPHIYNSEVAQVRLGDCLVNRFVFLDPTQKVRFGLLTGHVLVVRISRTDFQGNVRGDNRRVIANGLKENQHEAFLLLNTFLNLGPADVL